MTNARERSWEEMELAAAKMFSVWVGGLELEWAKEAWGHLYAAGLVGGETILEATAGRLRLVTLARIYQEFCGLAWDEHPETPLDYLAENLEIDPLALGILAAAGQADKFDDAMNEYELREAALSAVTDGQRSEIFQCLKAAYGNDVQIYTRLWHTRCAVAEKDSQDEEFAVTSANGAALDYVIHGFHKD